MFNRMGFFFFVYVSVTLMVSRSSKGKCSAFFFSVSVHFISLFFSFFLSCLISN